MPENEKPPAMPVDIYYRRKRPIGQKVLIKTFMYVEVSTHIEVFSCFCSYFIL